LFNSPEKAQRQKYLVSEFLCSEKIHNKIVKKIFSFRNKYNSEKKENNPNSPQKNKICFQNDEIVRKISVKKTSKILKKPSQPLKEFLKKAFNSEKKTKKNLLLNRKEVLSSKKDENPWNNKKEQSPRFFFNAKTCVTLEEKEKKEGFMGTFKEEREKIKEDHILSTTFDRSEFIEADKENRRDGENYQPSFLEKVYMEKNKSRKMHDSSINIEKIENNEPIIQQNQNFIEGITLCGLKKKERERNDKMFRKKNRKINK